MPENEGGDAATTNTAPAADPGQQATQQQQPPAEDWKAKYDEAVANSRRWEERAKKNKGAADELEQLKQQGMTDLEKQVADAKAAGAAEARQAYGARLVDAEVKAAAAGRPPEVVAALLEGLDRSRFLTDDGEPDSKAIAKWVERVAPAQQSGPPPLDLGQGARPGTERAPDMNDRLREDLFGRRR